MFDTNITVKVDPKDFKTFLGLLSELVKEKPVSKEVEQAFIKLKAQIQSVDDLIKDTP